MIDFKHGGELAGWELHVNAEPSSGNDSQEEGVCNAPEAVRQPRTILSKPTGVNEVAVLRLVRTEVGHLQDLCFSRLSYR